MEATPLWPAVLDHIRYDSADARRLADFYVRALGMTATPLAGGAYLLEAPGRRLIIGEGEKRQAYSAFALSGRDQLAAYRAFVEGSQVELLPASTPLFEEGAFAVRDPDGRLAAFGVPKGRRPIDSDVGASALPGVLQHVVVASARFRDMMSFYTDTLGFMVSDTVHADAPGGDLGDVNVCFLRADTLHHSFAVFRAPESRADHHAYETTGWNDLKLWADHFATLDVSIWWGPGRHGAGNNVFFMVKDPDGNNIEISAELETLEKGRAGKQWASGKRAINLWGEPWIRDTAPTAK